jgi:hypothetical protein
MNLFESDVYLVLWGLLGIVLTVAVVRNAARRVDRYGAGPWGLGQVAWGAIVFILEPLGLLAYWLATRAQDRTGVSRA